MEGRQNAKKTILYHLFRFTVVITLLAGALGFDQPATASTTWSGKVDPWVMDTAAQGETEFIVFLAQQADLSATAKLPTRLEKGTYVYQTLSELAARTQGPVIAQL